MKLLEMHEQVIKAISEIIGDMRVVDLKTDKVIDDFSVGTGVGHIKEFNCKYSKYLFIGYIEDDFDGPSYVFATFDDGSNDIGFFEYLTKDENANISDDIYTSSDLEYALDTAKKYAVLALKEIANQ